jgi:hypothetical protein
MKSDDAKLIIRCTVGSTVHGLALEGTDDRDEMGIMIEPKEAVTGLQYREHIVERTQPEGVRSGPGDLDLTIYGLRKWMRLAAGGNPTILMPLFVPPQDCSVLTARGNALRQMRKAIVSKKAGNAFLGYLLAQKQRLLGVRGQKRVKRPELVEQYGYDTKYAMHALRLGYQGLEIVGEGRMSLPMRPAEREVLMQVRRGEITFDRVVQMIEAQEQALQRAMGTSNLRDEPDLAAINAFLHETYMQEWGKVCPT